MISIKRTVMVLGLAIFIAGLLFPLSGCQPVEQNDEEPERYGRILVWHNLLNEQDFLLSDLFDNYMTLNPDVEIIDVYVPDEKLEPELIQAARAGLEPDMLLGFEAPLLSGLIKRGLLRDLTDDPIPLNTLAPQALAAVQSGDKRYAVPFAAYMDVLFINKKLAGEEVPKTLDELQAAADSHKLVGITADFVNGSWGIGAFGGQLFDDQRRVALDQGGFADWLSWLTKASIHPYILLSIDHELLQELFREGELAYLVCSATRLAEFQKSLGEENVGLALLPSGVGKPSPLVNVETLAITRDSPRADLGLDLINFLINTAQQRRIAYQDFGRVPASERIGQELAIDPKLAPMQTILIEQIKGSPVIQLGDADTMMWLEEFGDEVYIDVLEGKQTAAGGAVQLTQKVNRRIELSQEINRRIETK